MTVRMRTIDLLALLNDLVLTAAAEPGLAGCYGILLHTDRIDQGDEPGAVNVLIGTSTDGLTIGHSWTEAGGDLDPSLLPINYVHALRVSLKKLLNKDNREMHVTEIRREGDEITIGEDTDLFGGGFTQSFSVSNIDDFPRSAFQVLGAVQVTAPPEKGPRTNRTDYAASSLKPFLDVAARRGGFLRLFAVHQRVPVHVQISDNYLGVLVPSSWDEVTGEGSCPDVDVHPADLPPVFDKQDQAAELATTAPGGDE